MGLYSGGLIIGKKFASEIWGAYFREGLFCGGGGLIIGVLRYSHSTIWSIIGAVHVSPVYTDTYTGHKKAVEGHAWVGKVIFSCETSQDSLFLTVKSKVRKSGTFECVRLAHFLCEFDFIQLCSANELNRSFVFDYRMFHQISQKYFESLQCESDIGFCS